MLGGYYKLHKIPVGYHSRYWELWLSKHSNTGFWYIKLWVSKNKIPGSTGCPVLQECQIITQKAARSVMIPGGSLRGFLNNWKRRFFDFLNSGTRNRWVSDSDISKYREPMVIGKNISTAQHWLLPVTKIVFGCPSFTRPRESARSPSASRLLLRREFWIQSFCNSFVAVGRLLFDKKQATTQEKTRRGFFFCVF